jgi:cytoskeletal protein CcmA (bactofilin family)
MEGEKLTVIDAQTDVDGKLKGKDARILGRFRGEIDISGRLVLAEGSHVEANVKADAAEVGGEFKGDLTVRSLLLMEKARIEGKVDAQVLSVREGAQMNGTVSAGSKGASGTVAG